MALLLHGSLGLLGVNAAGDGIEYRQLRLLDRRDGIINREPRLPLKSLGLVFSAPGLSLSLSLGDSDLQRLDIGGDSYAREQRSGLPRSGLTIAARLLSSMCRSLPRDTVQ